MHGNGYKASFGVVMFYNKTCVARYGCYLHDMTNNEAEYHGAIAALRHIIINPFPRVILRLDSLLVTEQLNGRWACRAEHLKHLYEEGLRLMAQRRQNDAQENFICEHVYREYNAVADGVANEVAALYSNRLHPDDVVINDNWQ